MKEKPRSLSPFIQKDLEKKMVFLGGARQVGKTTLATHELGKYYKTNYFNWDKLSDRKQALLGEWPAEAELIILDEFHKNKRWKTWIKGEYDTHKSRFRFILTGSARLNVFRRGGDSLQGRYHYYRLHPFSLSELLQMTSSTPLGSELQFSSLSLKESFESLLEYGGFPEPLFNQDQTEWRRWQNERMERFFKEDIRDLTRIQDFTNLHLLAELLPERCSSILSINSIAQDLQVNHRTLSNWLEVFESFYYCFRLSAYATKKVNSVRKEKKMYLYDWSPISNLGTKLENMVASHLLKYCHFMYDTQGWKLDLYYLRDQVGREVDFLVCLNQKPWFAVEVKTQENAISKHLYYFKEKLNIPYCYQISLNRKTDYLKDQIRVMPIEKFLSAFV